VSLIGVKSHHGSCVQPNYRAHFLLFIEKYFRYKGANTAQSLKLEAEMLIVGQALIYSYLPFVADVPSNRMIQK
jgi:hypothetical protein